ncbi:hypothetical protein [Salinicoccus halodurans]|uniref:Replicative helicase inhibitor G39P N-terminal domain-containing protein n=1 Tax=Salinicoccus halodurans TaxID=407035 RepID=A0A0F7HMX8_9STAP|nr:hypothetical protein [Salinicoccus halodurans]AKG74382.1 hypothetical protein AAT16_09125 [Salinicoccus halodurans]SFK95215.1 hypothetical protein SAMN05216235_2724 [Salinicoccus halodurans]
MSANEAKEILHEIYILYPNFNRNNFDKFNETWLMKLMKGDYKKTKRKLMEYSEGNPYPPALADVLVKEHKPHQQVDMTIKEDRERVAAEMADPKKRAEREEKLKKLAAMEERMRKDVYERTDT